MLSILITETAINEVGKHNLFNNVFYKLEKNNRRYDKFTLFMPSPCGVTSLS